MKKGNIIRSIIAVEFVLLVPLITMIFTDEVDWDLRDFLIVSVLLAGMGVAFNMIVSGIKTNYRLAAVGIVLAALIVLIWAELAVGVFGTSFAGS